MGTSFDPSNSSSVPVDLGIYQVPVTRPDTSRGHRDPLDTNDPIIPRGDRGSDSTIVTPDNSSDNTIVPPDNSGNSSDNITPDPISSTPGGKSVPGSSVINPWKPDPSSSPEDNLTSLTDWLSNLFKFSNNYAYAGIQDPSFYANLFQLAASSLSRFSQGLGLENTAKVALIEKVSDWTANLVHEQFQMALSYQSWYLQQEYNSPINQINRLAQAGLASAFALGSVNSGNASSSAGLPSGSPVSAPSSAAEIQQQEEARKSSLLGSLISSTLSFIPGVGSAAAQLCSALWQQEAGRAMLPYNLAKAGADIVNSAQSFDNLQTANDQMQANMAIAEFNAGKSNLDFSEKLSRDQLEVAKSRYDSEYDKYSEVYEELGWQTIGVDKSGHTKSYRLTTEQVKKILSNGGRIDSNYIVQGSDSWSNVATGKATVELGKRNSSRNTSSSSTNSSSSETQSFGNKDFHNTSVDSNSNGTDFSSNLYDYLGVSGSSTIEDSFTKSHSDSKTNSHGTSQESSIVDDNTTSNVGYNEDGSQFRVGNSVFHSVTIRHRLPLPEYADHLNSLRIEYERLLDNYNTLTEGNKSRLHLLQEKLTRNLSRLSAGTVNANFQTILQKYLPATPRQLVGD